MMHASRGFSIAVVGFLSFVMLASARPALADEGAPHMDNRARAQQLFDSALADAEAGNLASACPKFLASQEADPKTSTLLNLAACYEKNGQTASAWGAYREAEGLARKISRSDWETTARAHAVALEPKLMKLTIQVPEPSRVSGLMVMRDGAHIAVGEWGVGIPVDPGEHVVTATAPGHVSWESRVSVRETMGTVAVPVLELLPPAPIELAVTPPPDRPLVPGSWWTPMRTTGVVVAGVGVVGLVTGTILGLAAKRTYDDAFARCNNGAAGCPADAVSDADSAYGKANGATVVFVAGACFAAGGAALILLSPSAAPRSGATTGSRPSAALRVGPGSIGLSGRW